MFKINKKKYGKLKFMYMLCVNINYSFNHIENINLINEQIKNNKEGLWINFKEFVAVDIFKNTYNFFKGFFKEVEPVKISLFSNIGDMEKNLVDFSHSRRYFNPIKTFWGEVIEGVLLEEMFKIFYGITNDILDYLGFNIDQNEIAKEINEKNFIKKNLILSDEESEKFNEIIKLLNLSFKGRNINSVIYVNGPAGIGKTSNIIHELGRNNIVCLYINASNILYGKYTSGSISHILSRIWNRALDLKRKGKKIVIIFDECESLIKKRNKKRLEGESVENTIINNRTDLEHALTVFFLYILAQRQVSVILISNPCYNENGILDVSEEMNRRINYIYEMELPSLKNLIKLWRFYILSYNIKITDENLEHVIYYLSQISFKKKISIRTISSITSALRGRCLKLQELISLV